MTRNEELALIIRVACLIEDRTDQEQRALMAWAWDCDKANNRLTITNRARRAPGWQWSDLVTEVHESRLLEDGQHEIKLPKRWVETWAMWEREAPEAVPHTHATTRPVRAMPHA